MTRDPLIRLFGWPALVLQGDILFAERVGWARRRLARGPARTLDAGCGAGGLTILAARLGNQPLGLTFDAAQADQAAFRSARTGGAAAAFRILDLRQLGDHLDEIGRGAFDQVIACEVIEHLIDDAGLIANLAALLAPGGRLLLTTPSADHHPVYREREHVSGVEDGRHVRFGYTHADLDRLFTAAGLRVEERGFLNGYFSQKVFSLYLRLGRLHPKFGWVATLPLRPLRFLDPIIRRLFRYPDMAVTAVAVRPEGAV